MSSQSDSLTAGASRRPATVCEAFQRTVASYPDYVALRTPNGAASITYAEYGRRVEKLAAGLSALGLGAGDSLATMLTNRPEFNLLDTAAMHLGATPFSVYNTLSPGQIQHLLENSTAKVAVVERAFLDTFLAAVDLYGRPVVVACIEGADEARGVLSFEELETASDPAFNFQAAWRAVNPDDVLTLIYTSGTTGPPKGVELTHANMLAECFSMQEWLEIRPGDRTMSYLPSAHIGDRWACHYSGMIFGAELTCIDDPRAVATVLPQVRPTFWGAVPRVFEKMHAALTSAIENEADPQSKAAMLAAIELGGRKVRLEQKGETLPPDLAQKHAALDARILSRFRAKLGLDACRWMVCGAAPLPRHVQEFLLAIGLPVTEVYGMSELSCCIASAPVDAVRIGAVGRVLPGMQVKLADDGEVLARGPTVMKGYRDQPGKTAETIDSEGWLHTGDIGQLSADGYLSIVDRKKEIIINSAGKNMSPANIEGELKGAHPLIGQAICIGDRRPYNVALLVLDPDTVAACTQARNEQPDITAFARDPAVRQEIADAVHAANQKLARVEQIKKFELLDQEWLPGGDELTPTMKLKRKPIEQKYSATIEALYAN